MTDLKKLPITELERLLALIEQRRRQNHEILLDGDWENEARDRPLVARFYDEDTERVKVLNAELFRRMDAVPMKVR